MIKLLIFTLVILSSTTAPAREFHLALEQTLFDAASERCSEVYLAQQVNQATDVEYKDCLILRLIDEAKSASNRNNGTEIEESIEKITTSLNELFLIFYCKSWENSCGSGVSSYQNQRTIELLRLLFEAISFAERRHDLEETYLDPYTPDRELTIKYKPFPRHAPGYTPFPASYSTINETFNTTSNNKTLYSELIEPLETHCLSRTTEEDDSYLETSRQYKTCLKRIMSAYLASILPTDSRSSMAQHMDGLVENARKFIQLISGDNKAHTDEFLDGYETDIYLHLLWIFNYEKS